MSHPCPHHSSILALIESRFPISGLNMNSSRNLRYPGHSNPNPQKPRGNRNFGSARTKLIMSNIEASRSNAREYDDKIDNISSGNHRTKTDKRVAKVLKLDQRKTKNNMFAQVADTKNIYDSDSDNHPSNENSDSSKCNHICKSNFGLLSVLYFP